MIWKWFLLAFGFALLGGAMGTNAMAGGPIQNGPVGRWAQVVPPNGIHPMAYDSTRQKVVMYAGDMWEWDGEKWQWIPTGGPDGSQGRPMVFDKQRDRMVLFVTTSENTGATWEWDGIRWSGPGEHNPPARLGHAMAYDGNLGGVVLFGGNDLDGNPLGDTWLLDEKGWTRIDVPGPCPRADAAMGFDEAMGTMILFGGEAGYTKLCDTWAWDGVSWSQLIDTACPYRTYMEPHVPVPKGQIVYNHFLQRLTYFSSDFPGQWQWTGRTWRRTESTSMNGQIVYDEENHQYLATGRYYGSPTYRTGGTWRSDQRGREWREHIEPGPNTPGTMISAGDKLVFVHSRDFYRERTMIWEGGAWRVGSEDPPDTEYGQALAYDSRRRRVILHGGCKTQNFGLPWLITTCHNQTWQFRPGFGRWSQLGVGGPGPHSDAAYDSHRDRVVAVSDSGTWEFDTSKWRKVSDATYSGSMLYDEARERVVHLDSSHTTREWDGKAWVVASVKSPPLGELVYDSQDQRVLCFVPGAGWDDVWEWNGAQWAQLPTLGSPGPSGTDGAVAFDIERGRPILFDGWRTWEYFPPDQIERSRPELVTILRALLGIAEPAAASDLGADGTVDAADLLPAATP